MNKFKIFTSEQPIYFKKNNINSSHVINYTLLNKSQLMDLWHRRLGHFDISKIKDKLNNTNVQTKCAICINSKLKNKSYKPTTNKTKQILDLIHIDLVGPVTNSINNNKYFLTILDDFARYGWVIFTQNKTDVFNKFIIWHNEIYNTTNITVKTIRSDNKKNFRIVVFKPSAKRMELNMNSRFLTIYLKRVELKGSMVHLFLLLKHFLMNLNLVMTSGNTQ